MQLYEYYLKRFIAGVMPAEFEKILLGEHEEIHAVTTNGMLVLSNKKIVKCVSEYYRGTNDDNTKMKLRAGGNVYLRCDNVRRNLGISVEPMACRHCHQCCLRAEREKKLRRKY